MTTPDLFADALWQFYKTGKADLRIERDDGYIHREDVSWYFATAHDFPAHERAALRFARGRILDLGCGAGRHSLYLQRRGLRVTAIDVSPCIVELARTRGVHDARVADICKPLPFRDGEFDTVVLFGNSLGICGTLPGFRKMLRELYRVTSPRGRILATTRQPSTTNPVHRAYLRKNIARRRAIGQVRIRLLFDGKRGCDVSSRSNRGPASVESSRRDAASWFELLLLAPTDLMQLAAKERWELMQVFPLESFESGYSVVMEKRR